MRKAEYGRRNIPLTTNLIIRLISKLTELSIKAGKISKKTTTKNKFYVI